MTSQPESRPVPPPALTRDKLLVLGVGLAGTFLVNLSGQFGNLNLADVQGGLGASADEASWSATVYLIGQLAGVVVATLMIQTFGLRRFVLVNAAVFALAGLGAALTPSLELLIRLRAIQGAAAGGFGPAAFVAVFMALGGPRLPIGASLLAFALTFPIVLSPLLSGGLEDRFGWRSLFLAQALVGAGLGAAASSWFPRQPVAWEKLKADWLSLALLATALGAFALVLSQGTRRFWLENPVIAAAVAVGLAASAGFAVSLRTSPQPLLNPRLLLQRTFGLSITTYSVFRFGLLATTWLVPQLLAVVHGYRPLQTAELIAWAAGAQLLAAPVAWALMHRLDFRVLTSLGLTLCAAAAWLAGGATNLAAAEQLRLPMALLGVGSMLFMLPGLTVGVRALTPPDLPTGSLVFNIATQAAGALAAALFSQLSTERQKFHSSVLTEGVSLYQPADADRLATLAASFARRLTDDDLAAARAAATLAAQARREAWVLAFNDSFAVLALVLVAGAAAALLIGSTPPLARRRPAPEPSETSAMKPRFVAPLGAAAVALVLGVFFLAPGARPFAAGPVETDNAFVRGDVTAISPKIAGYVVEVPVADNQPVRRGEVLARIDPADYRARVAQAEAAVAKARAALGNLDSRLALQEAVIAQADAAGRSADAAAVRAQRDLQRTQALVAGGWASQARYDDVQAQTLGADAHVSEARANAEAARSQIGVLESQRPQLQADVETALAALRLARIDLENTVIRAPVDGRVGERQARIGQYVRPGTQVAALVPHEAWIVANFKETQIRDLRAGDPVAVSVDAVPGALRGRVDSLSPASGAQFALLPPDNATGNFTRIVQRIPVKVALDPGQPGLERLRPGMSARVRVQTR